MGYDTDKLHDAVLQQARAQMSGVCNTIDTYHGEVRDIVTMLQQLPISYPACLVLYDGSTFSETARRSYTETWSLLLVLIAKDLRGGADLKDSMYSVLKAAKAAFIDQNLGLEINPLKPKQIKRELVTRDFSIYSFSLSTFFAY